MNYYNLLNLPKSASHQQIKNSYKKLVKQYHPDLYVGDKEFAEQKIKEINEAYSILSNAKKRSQYDEYLKSLEYSSTVPYSNSSSDSANTTNNTSSYSGSENILTKFITEKLNKLDKKRQLQIFVLFLVIILALFLINLIQVQYYLTNQNENSSDTRNVFNTTANTSGDFLETNTLYTEENLKTLDDLFNELLAPYFNEIY